MHQPCGFLRTWASCTQNFCDGPLYILIQLSQSSTHEMFAAEHAARSAKLATPKCMAGISVNTGGNKCVAVSLCNEIWYESYTPQQQAMSML